MNQWYMGCCLGNLVKKAGKVTVAIFGDVLTSACFVTYVIGAHISIVTYYVLVATLPSRAVAGSGLTCCGRCRARYRRYDTRWGFYITFRCVALGRSGAVTA